MHPQHALILVDLRAAAQYKRTTRTRTEPNVTFYSHSELWPEKPTMKTGAFTIIKTEQVNAHMAEWVKLGWKLNTRNIAPVQGGFAYFFVWEKE
jgi:hypothetical protein